MASPLYTGSTDQLNRSFISQGSRLGISPTIVSSGGRPYFTTQQLNRILSNGTSDNQLPDSYFASRVETGQLSTLQTRGLGGEGSSVVQDANAATSAAPDASSGAEGVPNAATDALQGSQGAPSGGGAGGAKNCKNPNGQGGQGGQGEDGSAGPVEPQTPKGEPLTPEEENALFQQLEAQEAERRTAAGLPREFSAAERASIKGILASEGGNSAANLATLLNRSYQSGVPINQVTFAAGQFTPALAASVGVNDVIAGSDPEGAARFTGGFISPATANLRSAVAGYESFRAQGVNYFNTASLGTPNGRQILNAGNRYQVGTPNPVGFRNGGLANYQEFLRVQGITNFQR